MKGKSCTLPANFRLTGGDVAGISGPLADMLLPGLGTALQFAGGMYDKAKAKRDSFKAFDEIKANTNSFGYAHGGKLTGSTDLGLYLGPSHANGGIMVNNEGTPDTSGRVEVEGKETLLRKHNYIFSHQLKV